MSRRRTRPVPSWGTAFASVHPGLEEVLESELVDLGVEATRTEGGVRFEASLANLVTVHVCSRVAGRVLVRLGTVQAGRLEQLAGAVRKLPWKRFVHHRQPVEVDVTSHRSRLRRKDAVAAKVGHAITDAMRGPRLAEQKAPRTPVRVVVRIIDDRATINVDASGDRLHKRGWRQATAKAPLRENLAAAVLHLADWRPGTPLVDPMCGAGTFPIEAARWARGLHPGQGRRFAFHDWPEVRPQGLGQHAPPPGRAVPTAFLAADRHGGAIDATSSNAERARVRGDLELVHTPFEELDPPDDPGLIVFNPPWGLRVHDRGSVTASYRRWGEVLRERWRGWRVAVVVPGGEAAAAFNIGLTVVARFSSGGTPVVVATTTVR